MNVGDVVVPNCEYEVLPRGYHGAIIVNTNPFVLVSVDADKVWACENPYNFYAICQAAPDIVAKAIEAYEKSFKQHLQGNL